MKNMDDWTALKMSLDENILRKQLLPSEISHELKRLYEGWKERRKKTEKSKAHKKKIYMISGHRSNRPCISWGGHKISNKISFI